MKRGVFLLMMILALCASVELLWGQNNQAGPAADPTETEGEAEAPDGDQPAAAENEAQETDEVADEDRRTQGEAFLLKLKQGGWTMVFLLAVSIFGVAYTIERLAHLRRGAIVPDGLCAQADKLWKNGQYDKLETLDEQNPSTLARALATVARHRTSGLNDVSMMAGDVAARDLKRHLQKAYPLAVVATLSPLLGLLGTVIGMIGAFDKVATAGELGDASLLGGDISKALITTGVGLAIAVPALAIYHFFRSRTSLYGIMLEEEVSELLTEWYSKDKAAEAGHAN
jgi:biopolymer transport protein ExbB